MFIAGVGMVCPVGLSAAAACTAKRAGISAFDDLPYRDMTGEPVVGSIVPEVDWELNREDRIIQLLLMALQDLKKQLPGKQWSQVPLLVALAEPDRGGGSAFLEDSIVQKTQEKLGVRFHPELSRAFPGGHTAGFKAAHVARELLANASISECIVSGVDSLVNAKSLLWLEQNFRLKTPANRDGVIPGEAAAAVLMRNEPDSSTSMKIVGLGFGKESAPVLSGEPMLGIGLASAARAALGEVNRGYHEIDLRLSDVTGELFGFKELSLAGSRLMRTVRKKGQPVWHWSEAIGDCGAAAGVAQLVLADQAFRKRYIPGEFVIGLTSSVPGERAAVLLAPVGAGCGSPSPNQTRA